MAKHKSRFMRITMNPDMGIWLPEAQKRLLMASH